MRVLPKNCPEHSRHCEVDFNVGDIGKRNLQFLLPYGGSPSSAARTELNLALVTAPREDSQIEASPFVLTPLYAALPDSHAAAQKEPLVLQDLAKDEWILFARRVHPVVHDAIMAAARREEIAPKRAHDIITPQEAVHLVSEHVGVAILTKPTALGFRAEGVVVRPLSDASLCFQTCVIMRKEDDSRLTNEFVRSVLRKYADHRRICLFHGDYSGGHLSARYLDAASGTGGGHADRVIRLALVDAGSRYAC